MDNLKRFDDQFKTFKKKNLNLMNGKSWNEFANN